MFSGAQKKWRYISPTIAIVVGIGLSLLGFFTLRDREYREIELRFQWAAEEEYDSLKKEIEFNFRILEAIPALVQASHDITRADFRSFITPFLNRHAGVHAFGWIPRVPGSQREAYELEARQDGLPRFQFKERNSRGQMVRAGKRDEFFPLYFVEPLKDNEAALGFDVATDPVREAALRAACDTGQIKATGKLMLIRTGNTPAILVFAPVYGKQVQLSSPRDRRLHLIGLALCVLRIGDILEHHLNRFNHSQVTMALYDDSAPEKDRLLCSDSAAGKEMMATPVRGEREGPEGHMRYVEHIDVAGRSWTAVFTPAPGYLAAQRGWEPWIRLTAGALFTLLLAAYLYMIIGRARRIEGLIEERTRDLSQANAALQTEIAEHNKAVQALNESEKRFRLIFEQSPIGTALLDAKDGHFTKMNRALCVFSGFSQEELAQRTFAQITHPDDLSSSWSATLRLLRGEVEGFAMEKRYIRKDGSTAWGHLTVRAVKDGSGNTLHTLAMIQDITQRKQTEYALRESEANFRTFVESMTDMVIVAATDGRLLYTNAAVTRTTGYAPDELATMRVTDMHPADRQQEAEEIIAAICRDEGEECTLPLARKDGGLVPVSTRVSFGRWSGTDCMIGIAKDLTAVVEAEERFQRLFRNNPVPMALSSLPDRRLLDVNDVWLGTLGYTRTEVIGKTPAELGVFADHEQGVTVAEILDRARHLLGFEVRARRKDGAIVHGVLSGEVIESQRGQYLLTVMIDVTARKRAENALALSEENHRSLVESSSDGIIVIDTARIIRSCNQSFLNLFGYQRHEIENRSIRLIHASDASFQEFGQKAFRALEDCGAFRTEWDFVRKDGSTVSVESVTFPIKGPDGSIRQYAAIIRDISERRKAEERIRAALHEKEVLLKEIHHRVKNNLQIISSLLFLQTTKTDHPGAISALRESRDRVKSMALIHERLYRSLNFSSVDMNTYTRTIVSELKRSYRIDTPSTRFTLDIGDIHLGITEAIPCALIINELVSNAIKHAFPEGREGHVTIRLQRGSDDRVTLCVSDDGIGFPKNVDFRNSSSLGLKLVTSLVDQINGHIELDTTSGATFTIRLG